MTKLNKKWIAIGVIILIVIMMQGRKEVRKLAGGTLTRVLSANEVQPDGTFTVKYEVQNPVPPFFFSIKDSIGGGCTSFGSTDIITTLTSPQTATGAITIQAPSFGSCTFTGDWKMGAEDLVNFPSMTVSIVSPSCTPATEDTDCSADTECRNYYCDVNTCAYTNINEGSSCDAGAGTCQSGECILTTCTPSWTCTSWSPAVCPSSCQQTRTCTDANDCGTTSGKPAEAQTCTGGNCVAPECTTNSDCADKICQTKKCDAGECKYTITPTASCTIDGKAGTCSSAGACIADEAEEDECEFYQTFKDGECKTAGWVYLAIGFMAFMIFFKMM